MKARISAIPTVYGIGCAGVGCGGLGDINETDTLLASDVGVSDQVLQSQLDGILGSNPYSGTPTNTTNGTTTVGSTNMLSAITGLTNAFTSIFKAIQPLPSGCTVVAGPYGQSTQCSPQGSQQLALNSSVGGSGLSMTTILLIGGGLVLVMMMNKGK